MGDRTMLRVARDKRPLNFCRPRVCTVRVLTVILLCFWTGLQGMCVRIHLFLLPSLDQLVLATAAKADREHAPQLKSQMKVPSISPTPGLPVLVAGPRSTSILKCFHASLATRER